MIVEMRCPGSNRRLFGKLLVERDYRITSGNLIEFACRECRRTRETVLHRYNVAGELVETVRRPHGEVEADH